MVVRNSHINSRDDVQVVGRAGVVGEVLVVEGVGYRHWRLDSGDEAVDVEQEDHLDVVGVPDEAATSEPKENGCRIFRYYFRVIFRSV